MKRVLYYFSIFLFVFSVIISLVGGWYIIFTKSSPEWMGNVIAAYTGGILGIVGNLIQEWLRRFVERRRRREDIRYTQVTEIRTLLSDVRSCLSRLHSFLEAKQKGHLLSGVAPAEEEVETLWRRYRAVPGFLDSQTQEIVHQALREGLLLLIERRVSLDKLEEAENKCGKAIAALDRIVEIEV